MAGILTDALATLAALLVYERRIVPLVDGELERWEARAAAIPDPVLREAALSALREKSGNVRAVAVFGILAPRANRAAALRAMSALQVAIDYLDSLGEQPVDDPLADGLRLHGALLDAVSPNAELDGWYELHPQHQDGGYLEALVAECRERLGELPAADRVLPRLRSAAKRCGEGQSHTHASVRIGSEEMKAWAEGLAPSSAFLWWELAAGASSSVAAHALIAAAADTETTAAEAELIDAAYFPPIGALTVLLDDLVDRDEDLAAGHHSYLGYCADEHEVAGRIGLLASLARARTEPLRRARRHRAILDGVAAFYLSAPSATGGYARPIRERLFDSLGSAVRLIMVAMSLRRHD